MNNKCICKIRRIYRCISEFEAQIQKTFGLNFNEAMLLCVLSEKDKLLSGEIADELQLSRSNASKVIASREKNANQAQCMPARQSLHEFSSHKKRTRANRHNSLLTILLTRGTETDSRKYE